MEASSYLHFELLFLSNGVKQVAKPRLCSAVATVRFVGTWASCFLLYMFLGVVWRDALGKSLVGDDLMSHPLVTPITCADPHVAVIRHKFEIVVSCHHSCSHGLWACSSCRTHIIGAQHWKAIPQICCWSAAVEG
eukprot:5542826-Amphidinium_carterae.1